MEFLDLYPVFDCISQRVAHSYRRSLAGLGVFTSGEGDGPHGDEMEASQWDLHAYFEALYERLLQEPELFGLPLSEDAFLEGDEADMTRLKQELNKKLKKPRELIAYGLDFLSLLGTQGEVIGEQLVLDEQRHAAFLKYVRDKKRFLQGMQAVGLEARTSDGTVVFHSEHFPAMMPALKALATACSQYEDERLGKFNFARCDFRALEMNYCPAAMDLYRIFAPIDYQRIARLHDFLCGLDYKPIIRVGGVFAWEIQYQGNRKIKASPLVRIEYSERYRNPLRVNIKCASSDRLIPLIYQQSETLRKDFMSRAYECRGDECGWCRNKKHLGPSEYELDGETRTICWYSNPDFLRFDDSALELVEEYALLHEELA